MVEALCGEVTLCEKSLLGELAQGPVHDKGIVAELFGACAGGYFRGDFDLGSKVNGQQSEAEKGQNGGWRSKERFKYQLHECRVKGEGLGGALNLTIVSEGL
ncbi:MAG: hypothetical protein KDD27_09220 [Saprospiraceae bacterium]|nr:hypothetical protein [Saprospiraceae bacterium]